MVITLRYFAWVREKLQKERETITLPENTKQPYALSDLLTMLYHRGGAYELLQSNQSLLRYALNQQFANPNHIIKNGDEVAIFPPVTGG